MRVQWASLSLVAILLLPGLALAQVAPDWFGSWQLDVSRSTYSAGPIPYVRGKWIIRREDDGRILMVYEQVGVRGGVTHLEWKGRFDGADYRLHGPDTLVTYAYSVVNERTLGLLVKVDGHQTATATIVLSPDGTITATTRTATARGTTTAASVYYKR